jgi:hypothetical protein
VRVLVEGLGNGGGGVEGAVDQRLRRGQPPMSCQRCLVAPAGGDPLLMGVDRSLVGANLKASRFASGSILLGWHPSPSAHWDLNLRSLGPLGPKGPPQATQEFCS